MTRKGEPVVFPHWYIDMTSRKPWWRRILNRLQRKPYWPTRPNG